MRRLAAATVLVLLGAGAPALVPTASAVTEPGDRVITVAGSLQDEIGCAADWSPACDASELEETSDGVYEAELTLDDGRRLNADQPLGRRNGRPLWAATIPANGSRTLRYRIAG